MRLAALALLAASVLGCAGDTTSPPGTPDAPPGRNSAVFTSPEDWTRGSSTGVASDPSGDLVLNAGANVFDTPFIWIPNSIDRTVSRIDTRTHGVVGTHALRDGRGNDCWNPSRTTVDLEGNVWVGCRGTSSYINRDQLTPDMVPVTVDKRVVKLSVNGTVLLSREVGHAPRALAIDARNHLFVGCSVDDTVWEIDGDTGECYRGEASDCHNPAIPVTDFPYGMAIDQRGHGWVVGLGIPTESNPRVTEFDTLTGQVYGTYGIFNRGGCIQLYGIAIDQLNDVWLGGFGCSDVVKLKGVAGVYAVNGQTYAAGQMIAAYSTGGEATRGVAVDLDGNVWAAMSSTSTASKLNGATGELIRTVNVGAGPIGIGVDAWGNVWAVNRGADSVTWIPGTSDPTNTQPTQTIPVGAGPYTYSDMLGLALRTITRQGFGTWRSRIDSGVASPTWTQVNWDAEEPDGTDLRVHLRCAGDEATLEVTAFGDWMEAPGPITNCGGRYLDVEVEMRAFRTGVSPVLHNITVYWQ